MSDEKRKEIENKKEWDGKDERNKEKVKKGTVNTGRYESGNWSEDLTCETKGMQKTRMRMKVCKSENEERRNRERMRKPRNKREKRHE